MKTRAIFIGNGFVESQLLYSIPFLIGYAREIAVQCIIFEREPSARVLENPNIKTLLQDFDVVFQPGMSTQNNFNKTISFMKKFFSIPIFSVIQMLGLSRERLISEHVSWYQQQISHAVWDTALRDSKDGQIQLSVGSLLRAGIRVFRASQLARKLCDKYVIEMALVGHSVYEGRAVIAEFRRENVDVIAQAAHVFHRLEREHDSSWMLLPRVQWDVLRNSMSTDFSSQFWDQRLRGEGSYEDARRAISKASNVIEGTPRNLIFLHIFRDSPFNSIDPDRIFPDYVSWIIETLKILSISEEKWLVRLHPSAEKWGEDQYQWLEAIYASLTEQRLPSNVSVSDAEVSNIALLQHARRLVTYHGTVHLEAACSGIRPIVISNVSLGSYDCDLILKPKSTEEYRDFLLRASDDATLALSEDEIQTARDLLAVREELLPWREDVGACNVYRGDPASIYEKDFSGVENKLSQFQGSMELSGKYMARGLPRTVGFKYLRCWIEHFFNTET